MEKHTAQWWRQKPFPRSLYKKYYNKMGSSIVLGIKINAVPTH